MDREVLLSRNRSAWNALVKRGNRWTVPVDSAAIERARNGDVRIVLTPQQIVPPRWFPELQGCRTLMLASGGGQQAPILAAAGADVTVVDLSDAQLEQDRKVAERESLSLRTLQASMDDLSAIDAGSFDLVIHPCSNSFVSDLEPVWNEVARVTDVGGVLMTGFCNPLMFLFDEDDLAKGNFAARYALPYSDLDCLSQERLQDLEKSDEPLMFGHTLTDQIGKQLRAGFAMHDMFEDHWGADDENPWSKLDAFAPTFMATRSVRTAS